MRYLLASLAMIATGLALNAGASAVHASNSERALTLKVIDNADSVEVQVIANSPVTQQIEFEAELTGSSTSRHKSSTSIAAGNRQVLSRMKASKGEAWCAKVEVSEASGARYTLTAGDCGLI